MKKAVVKTYSAVGLILCIVYPLLCIWGEIGVSGEIWDYSESGNSDYAMYMGWSWEEVEAARVAIIALAAVSFIIPRCAYFFRLRRTGRYSFWLFDVRTGWAKAGCLLYDLLNLSLTLSIILMLAFQVNSGPMEGDVVLRYCWESMFFFYYLILFAPAYWLCSIVICAVKLKKTCFAC